MQTFNDSLILLPGFYYARAVFRRCVRPQLLRMKCGRALLGPSGCAILDTIFIMILFDGHGIRWEHASVRANEIEIFQRHRAFITTHWVSDRWASGSGTKPFSLAHLSRLRICGAIHRAVNSMSLSLNIIVSVPALTHHRATLCSDHLYYLSLMRCVIAYMRWTETNRERHTRSHVCRHLKWKINAMRYRTRYAHLPHSAPLPSIHQKPSHTYAQAHTHRVNQHYGGKYVLGN